VQGRDPRDWPVSDASSIRRFFEGLRAHVVCFSGYGELGYQQDGVVKEVAAGVLADWAPRDLIVLTGTLLRTGGQDGIAAVYEFARERGIRTAGIHPSAAQRFWETHRVSPWCDDVFFVEDGSWGGYLEGGSQPSPTLRVHLSVADELVVIGGGKHAADELKAFVEHGRRVRYFAAQMHHLTTQEWARGAGAEIRDLRGAAHGAWESLQHPPVTPRSK
jgi:hypothetical protein